MLIIAAHAVTKLKSYSLHYSQKGKEANQMQLKLIGRKFLSVIVAFALVTASLILPLPGTHAKAACTPSGLWYSYVDTSWYTDHKSDSVYHLTTASQLAGVGVLGSSNNYFLGKTIYLDNDIDLSAHYWVPIFFYGNFDGNNCTISNMTIDVNKIVGDTKVGLFSEIRNNAVIKNTNITNFSIFSVNAGALVGDVYSGCIVENCSASRGSLFIAGIAGSVGGLIGSNSGSIINCRANADVDGEGDLVGGLYAGGLVGQNDGIIQGCYAGGNVHLITYGWEGNVLVGGLVGLNYGLPEYAYGTIESSFSTANVKNETVFHHQTVDDKIFVGGLNPVVGGLIGENEGTISNCCAISGTVTAEGNKTDDDGVVSPSTAYTGGLAGINSGIITASYSASGSIKTLGTVNSCPSGFVSSVRANPYTNIVGTDTSCYFDKTSTGLTADVYSGTAIGLETNKMQGSNASTYMSFVSNSPVWALTTSATCGSDYYPHLTGYSSLTVIFNSEGGSSVPDAKVKFYEKVTLPQPSKLGYTFKGWYTDAMLTIPFDGNSRIYSSMVLYAKWEASNYNITYNLDGGTNNVSNPSSYTYGVGLTLSDPAKVGYTFGGWFSDAGLTKKVTSIGTDQTGDMTLYAKWEANNYNIIYNLDGGTNNVSNPSSYTYGVGLTLSDPTKVDYTFGGWFSDAGLTTKVTSISVNETGTVMLYANWLPKEITAGGITFDLGSATLPAGVTSVLVSSTMMPQSGTGDDSYRCVLTLINDDASLGSLQNLVVYDLKLLNQNGDPVKSFAGKIKVKVPIPSGMSGNLHVLWYDDSTNALTDMGATQEDGYMVFETSHFGYYAIAKLGYSTPVSNPNTGLKGWSLIPLAVISGSWIVGLLIIKRRKTFRCKFRL
jgi:uncharacterized repeat protein (TIGR02543 family)